MKVLCAEYNNENEPAIVPMGDDVLLRNNQDFYLPEFTTTLSGIPQLVVRMEKLGKSITEQFASRYYEEIGVGIRFYADSLEGELQEKGLPTVVAASFDSSAAISVMRKKQTVMDYGMRVNGEMVFEGSTASMSVKMESLIALASGFHTIKIGDYLYCGNTFRYRGLQIGDHLELFLARECLLDFYIK